MIYRGPGFLVVPGFGFMAALLTGQRREGGGRGAESYDCKKACSSVNHSILFGITIFLASYTSQSFFYI
jgi:hypothetical protein